MNRMKKQAGRFLQYLLMSLIALIAFLPFYVMVFVALNDASRPLSEGVFSAPQLTLENLREAWMRSDLGNAILNSAVITGGGIVIVVLFGAMAGYVIARYPTKFNRFWFAVFLGCMMVPGIINTVPLYMLMQKIHGINQLWSMTLLLSCNRLPFCIFLYASFIRATGRDIEEAAIIDGCTPFSAFWRVTFHIIKPVTSTVIITSSVGFWNNYNQTVFFLQKKSSHTIPLAVSSFYTEFSAEWNLVAAAALIGVIPIVIVFLCLQKYFIKGLAAGAVKG